MNFWLHIVVLGNKIWFYYCFFMCNFRNSVQLFLREKSKQLWELQLVRYKSHLETSECLDDCLGTRRKVICIWYFLIVCCTSIFYSYDTFPSPSNAVSCSNTAAVRLSSSNLQPWNSLGQFLTYLFILKWLVIVGYVHCIHCHILCCCACHWVLNPDSVMFYFAVWFSRGHAKNWRNSES